MHKHESVFDVSISWDSEQVLPDANWWMRLRALPVDIFCCAILAYNSLEIVENVFCFCIIPFATQFLKIEF